VVLGTFIYYFALTGGDRGISGARSYALAYLMIFMVFQLVVVIFLFGEDLARLVIGGFRKWSSSTSDTVIPSRRKFLSAVALGVASIPFAGLLYGIYKGKYDFRVLTHILEF